MDYYQREGSDYKELENHSTVLREMDKFTTSTTVISGPNYDYVRETMTPAFYQKHLVDTTTISGPEHIYLQECQEHVPSPLRRDCGVPQGEQPRLLAAVVE